MFHYCLHDDASTLCYDEIIWRVAKKILPFFRALTWPATRCLHGNEVRTNFNEDVAQLYHDLDKGFTALAWFLPKYALTRHP